MKKINVGLIGYGNSGSTIHAPLLQVLDQFEIRKVMSSNPEEVVYSELGNIEVVRNLEDLLEDAEIELVVITTPNSLHYEMTKKSLMHKKHVVLEKPMVIDVFEAEALIQIANENNCMLSVYQNRRWDNDFLTVKHLVTEGILGEINTYEAHYDRYNPRVSDCWRERRELGLGILFDLGSHLIDQALYLFGDPQFVMADVFAQREGAVTDDYFHITLGYDRLRVILHSASLVTEQGPKFEVNGSKGSFVKYGIDKQYIDLKEGKNPSDSDWGKDNPEWYGQLLLHEDDGKIRHSIVETIPGSHASYYKGVYEHIYNGKPCPVSAEDGLKTIKIIQAAVQSSQEKRTIFLYKIVLNWRTIFKLSV